MQIKKLLFVTTFEDIGFNALLSLMDLQKAALSHVVFLKVIEQKKMGVPVGENKEIRLREIANIRFTDWAEELFQRRVEVGVCIVVGNLLQQVLLAAREEAPDLIVVGLKKQGALDHFFSGSRGDEIAHRTKKPVLVYKHHMGNRRDTKKPFERPLLASDLSPGSQAAVSLLKGLKNVVQEVSVVHVATKKELKATSPMDIQATRKTSLSQLDKICEEFEMEGIHAKAHLYVGAVKSEIEKASKECGATMIVIGASGKSIWYEKVFGNLNSYLSTKSSLPVLIVPAGFT